MTYEAFQAECQRRARECIRDELLRMEKARNAWSRYNVAMRDLGLHALSQIEIEDRWRELQRMARDVPQQYGNTPMMRAAYAMRKCTCA